MATHLSHVEAKTDLATKTDVATIKVGHWDPRGVM